MRDMDELKILLYSESLCDNIANNSSLIQAWDLLEDPTGLPVFCRRRTEKVKPANAPWRSREQQKSKVVRQVGKPGLNAQQEQRLLLSVMNLSLVFRSLHLRAEDRTGLQIFCFSKPRHEQAYHYPQA